MNKILGCAVLLLPLNGYAFSEFQQVAPVQPVGNSTPAQNSATPAQERSSLCQLFSHLSTPDPAQFRTCGKATSRALSLSQAWLKRAQNRDTKDLGCGRFQARAEEIGQGFRAARSSCRDTKTFGEIEAAMLMGWDKVDASMKRRAVEHLEKCVSSLEKVRKVAWNYTVKRDQVDTDYLRDKKTNVELAQQINNELKKLRQPQGGAECRQAFQESVAVLKRIAGLYGGESGMVLVFQKLHDAAREEQAQPKLALQELRKLSLPREEKPKPLEDNDPRWGR
jgi:hypothetical protein